MFEKLAKFRRLQRPLRSWCLAPGLQQITPANDNRLHQSDRGVKTNRPQLVWRWSLIEESGRLACRWELEGSEAPDRSLDRDLGSGAKLHKIFFQLSYQPSVCRPARLTDGVPSPCGEPNALADSLSVLHVGHAQMPSTDGAAAGSCSCKLLAITLSGCDFDWGRFFRSVG
jgi:hypothetical protein